MISPVFGSPTSISAWAYIVPDKFCWLSLRINIVGSWISFRLPTNLYSLCAVLVFFSIFVDSIGDQEISFPKPFTSKMPEHNQITDKRWNYKRNKLNHDEHQRSIVRIEMKEKIKIENIKLKNRVYGEDEIQIHSEMLCDN